MTARPMQAAEYAMISQKTIVLCIILKSWRFRSKEQGLGNFTGDYIGFVDSDDWIDQNV